MQHKLPELPWPKDSLEPHISAETIDFHYGKHHNAYVEKLNKGIEGTKYAEMDLEAIVKESKKSDQGIFNNAAQVWNHTFYWNCLSPKGGGKPTGKIAEKIDSKFGSFDKFKEEFAGKAGGNFGSGWTWLIENNGEIEVMNTDDADTPLAHGKKALLTADVWEHAYYIDYRNARPKYIEHFWNLVNWDFVNSKL